MEQNTEASQAVDLPMLPGLHETHFVWKVKPEVIFMDAWVYKYSCSQHFAPLDAQQLFTADQMKAYARAALKAQPAPHRGGTGRKPVQVPAMVERGRDGRGMDCCGESARG